MPRWPTRVTTAEPVPVGWLRPAPVLPRAAGPGIDKLFPFSSLPSIRPNRPFETQKTTCGLSTSISTIPPDGLTRLLSECGMSVGHYPLPIRVVTGSPPEPLRRKGFVLHGRLAVERPCWIANVRSVDLAEAESVRAAGYRVLRRGQIDALSAGACAVRTSALPALLPHPSHQARTYRSRALAIATPHTQREPTAALWPTWWVVNDLSSASKYWQFLLNRALRAAMASLSSLGESHTRNIPGFLYAFAFVHIPSSSSGPGGCPARSRYPLESPRALVVLSLLSSLLSQGSELVIPRHSPLLCVSLLPFAAVVYHTLFFSTPQPSVLLGADTRWNVSLVSMDRRSGHDDADWPRLFSPTTCSASRKDHDMMAKVGPTGDAWTSRTPRTTPRANAFQPRSFLLQSSSVSGASHVVSCVELVVLSLSSITTLEDDGRMSEGANDTRRGRAGDGVVFARGVLEDAKVEHVHNTRGREEKGKSISLQPTTHKIKLEDVPAKNRHAASSHRQRDTSYTGIAPALGRTGAGRSQPTGTGSAVVTRVGQRGISLWERSESSTDKQDSPSDVTGCDDGDGKRRQATASRSQADRKGHASAIARSGSRGDKRMEGRDGRGGREEMRWIDKRRLDSGAGAAPSHKQKETGKIPESNSHYMLQSPADIVPMDWDC
ncbi:hypothetical protein B0H10DRAFT_1968771 [Mycena sp. CBHHK59/15]|nr:hypothetical protein B0H10DRAFT_1968771 [Mycena sp. CBHHK59/15]